MNHNKSLTSAEACPDISLEDQTRMWTAFYVAIDGIKAVQAEDLTQVVSENLGHKADGAIIEETLVMLRAAGQ